MPNAKTDGVSSVSEETLSITSHPEIENANFIEAVDGLGLAQDSSLLLPELDRPHSDSIEKSLENSPESPFRFETLDARSVALERVTWWILIGTVGILLLAGWLIGLLFMQFEGPLWIALASIVGILAGLILLSRSIPQRVYATTFWQMRPKHGLEIRRGIWWRHRIFIPRNRIQHSDVRQGPLERRFGLATLIVNTGGTHEPSIELSGLKLEIAEGLRDQLCSAGPDK